MKPGLKRLLGPRLATTAALQYDAWRGSIHANLGSYSKQAHRLRRLRNRHAGERCFIIGNGPSLRQMDLSPLRDEYTFGQNRIYLNFPDMGFATTFLVCVNALVWEQFGERLALQDSTIYAPWHERERLAEQPNVYFIRTGYRPFFRRDIPRDGVWEGGTVTFVSMQLAHYLGFRQVILIGVDHSFSAQGPPNATVVSSGPDADHFDPSYFGAGVRWQLPDLGSSELAYRSARKAFGEDGREILDATVGGRLDIFPKVDYESLF